MSAARHWVPRASPARERAGHRTNADHGYGSGPRPTAAVTAPPVGTNPPLAP
jgi:hypothetical protein